MGSRTYGSEEKAKLERLINEGVQIKYEIESLTEGLKEAVKAVADELEIKPALINKAISIAHKGNWNDVFSDFDDLETLIVTVGKDK
jgi:hypothetical protein